MDASKSLLRTSMVLVVCAGFALADKTDWVRHPVSLKLGPGVTGQAVYGPADLQITPDLTAQDSVRAGRPIPVGGFIPYVAFGLTDARETGEFLYEHHLTSYVYGNPLISPMSQHFEVGTLDTGATMHLIGHCQREAIGMTESYLTGNTIPIGGASGTTEADVSWPMGVYMTGFQNINPSTGSLNTSGMRGHWQVSVATLPDDDCEDGVNVSTVIGMPLIPFCDIEIRNDRLCVREHNGQTYIGPEVNVKAQYSSTLDYPKDVFLDALPAGKTTTAYYPDIANMDFETPWIPSSLCESALSIPTGAWFFASVRIEDGTSGELSKMFMFDTGAQVSVIRSFIAGQLGLDLDKPEFEVEILGASGDIEMAPGFFIDFFKLDASGGPITFEAVPVVVLDMTSIEGGTLDGIVGMNVLYNRSIVIKPELLGASVMEISDPITNAFPGDFDQDTDVDLDDFLYFDTCLQGPGVEPAPYFPCVNAFDFDEDGDVDLEDFGSFQVVFEGSN